MQWCRLHWLKTFKPSLANHNIIYFHYCCSCFSKRRFICRSGHPVPYTISLQRLGGYKEVESEEDFYHFMLVLLESVTEMGIKAMFPGLNMFHRDEDRLEVLTATEQTELLGKRLEEMTTELDYYKKKNKELEVQNEHLLKASWSWYVKYNEAFEKLNLSQLTLFDSPQKTKPNYSSCFPDELNYLSSLHPSLKAKA